jgi:5-methyltetrahydrofolate corrinoid/iron sulfur protein methyltransferase
MIVAADNINPMNQAVARAVDAMDAEPIRVLARRCAAAGAAWIDINPGPLSAKRRGRICFLVEAVQDAADARLILDSADPDTIAEGMRSCRVPPVISALTLEPRKLARMTELALESGADLVALLLDAESRVAPTVDEKIALAISLWQHCEAAGLPAERLIIDPVAPHWSWPDAPAQAAACVQAVRLLASGAALGFPVRTMCGVSNLRSGQKHIFPAHIEHTFLTMLAGAGLKAALCNALDPELLQIRSHINLFIE